MVHHMERKRLLRQPFALPTPALFLDRDGVLIEDRHHLRDPAHVELCPGAHQLLQEARIHRWPVVVITNQSGISRGYFEWGSYERVTDRLLELVGPKAPIAAIYANGHGPNAPANSWRKPCPGMLWAAQADLNLDLSRSLLIGDRLSDLQAGAQAKVSCLFHVLSGHGASERSQVQGWLTPKKPLLLNSLLDFPVELLSHQP